MLELVYDKWEPPPDDVPSPDAPEEVPPSEPELPDEPPEGEPTGPSELPTPSEEISIRWIARRAEDAR